MRRCSRMVRCPFHFARSSQSRSTLRSSFSSLEISAASFAGNPSLRPRYIQSRVTPIRSTIFMALFRPSRAPFHVVPKLLTQVYEIAEDLLRDRPRSALRSSVSNPREPHPLSNCLRTIVSLYGWARRHHWMDSPASCFQPLVKTPRLIFQALSHKAMRFL
jgi:hypothetical protein